MKRYDVWYEEDIRETEDGAYVEAIVAQALYDALLNLKEVEESELVGVAWKNARNRAVKRARKALSIADGEE